MNRDLVLNNIVIKKWCKCLRKRTNRERKRKRIYLFICLFSEIINKSTYVYTNRITAEKRLKKKQIAPSNVPDLLFLFIYLLIICHLGLLQNHTAPNRWKYREPFLCAWLRAQPCDITCLYVYVSSRQGAPFYGFISEFNPDSFLRSSNTFTVP